MESNYYQPTNVFRQPAIIVKKRSQRMAADLIDTSGHHKKSWQNNASKIGSPLLRKASDDYNDHYTTKKLKSEYWKINNETRSASLPSDLSVVDDTLLISNMDSKDNLKLINIKQPDQEEDARSSAKLHELQSISVPGNPIISASLLSNVDFAADFVDGHDQLLLSGHQDGVVNLISTSIENGNAKIVKRYNHGKYLSHKDPATLDSWLQSYNSLPVRKLKPWNGSGFTSLVNDSLFIYDLNRTKSPQYLQSFSGIESLAINKNPYLLSLCGSQFGRSGVALLDLRCDQGDRNIYLPDSNTTASSRLSSSHTSSYDCVWIDEYHVANCANDAVKVWDIRSTGGETKCEMLPMKGCIESLSYHSASKTLYTSDDQGYIISWDLTQMDGMKKGILAQGFNSIIVQNENELLHEVSRCGNIVVNGGNSHKQNSENSVQKSIYMESLINGSLVTLNSTELGLHQICNVQCHALTAKANEPTYNYAGAKARVIDHHEESDTTLLAYESSSLSAHSDCSSSHTLHSNGLHESPELSKQFQAQTNSASIYSMNNLVLSGSTIYQ